MSRKLVAAQVGCGAFAAAQHGPNLTRNKNISKIKWACDISDKNLKNYSEKFKAEKITKSFEEAVTDPEVDIVTIATSHDFHVPIIESAAAHGKHIFCEKPLAMNEEQAYKIIKAVRKNKVKLCVDYMRRMAPALVALKSEWKKHKENPKRQPWRYVDPCRLEKNIVFEEEKCTDFQVRVQDESSSYRLVHLDPFKGGGLIIGEAVHWLDLSSWLFENDRPVEIRAWGSARMRYGIYVVFQSGNTATITFTPNGSFDYPKEQFEIACDGALFRSEFYVENQYYGRPGVERETFKLQRDPCPEIGAQGGFAGFMEKKKKYLNKDENSYKLWETLQANHGYEEIFDGFVDSVLKDTKPPCNELDGFRATLLGELAMKSIMFNQPVPVPVEKWDYYIEL